MNIVFYSNCQCRGIKYFLEEYLKNKNIIINFIEMENNYQMIKNNSPLPIDVLQLHALIPTLITYLIFTKPNFF